jgi:hypothetical protein
MHRRNAAERAIQTLKIHSITGLCSVDPNSPLQLWDRLLPQATITLNLMRQSCINPKVSAYAQLYTAIMTSTMHQWPRQICAEAEAVTCASPFGLVQAMNELFGCTLRFERHDIICHQASYSFILIVCPVDTWNLNISMNLDNISLSIQ